MNARNKFLPTLFLLFSIGGTALAQQPQTEKPFTNEEFVRLIYQLSNRPEKKEEVIQEVKRRGIGFSLTSGMRSLIATKTRNDADLRRTIEEADRRRANPSASALPSEAEGQEVLARAKEATLAAAGEMPDFVVKQIIRRSVARGSTRNWRADDQLTVAVSYRADAGEQYKVLAVNGLPAPESAQGGTYEQLGGTSSTGEFVSLLKTLFDESTKAKFKMSDTDLLRGRRAIVYDYEVKLENSKQTIKAGPYNSVVTGYRGRVWLDRENYRVLRLEDVSTDIPSDFPVTAASSRVDYDWVVISDNKYLLPISAHVELTSGRNEREYQSRNEIRFRNYQKFGSEVKILEDDGADLPEEPAAPPTTP